MSVLTQERAKQLFDYDPSTGELRWKERSRSDFKHEGRWKAFNSKYVGRVAGSRLVTNKIEYTQLCIGVKQHLAHRVVWIWVHGEMPNIIDHINGNGRDNRIENLRNVDAFDNMKNTKLSSRNKTGVIGVAWEESRKRWKAVIRDGERTVTLGRFKDFREACEERLFAEMNLGYHPNHGRVSQP